MTETVDETDIDEAQIEAMLAEASKLPHGKLVLVGSEWKIEAHQNASAFEVCISRAGVVMFRLRFAHLDRPAALTAKGLASRTDLILVPREGAWVDLLETPPFDQ